MKKLITKYVIMEAIDHGDCGYLLSHPRSGSSWMRSTTFNEYGYDTLEEAYDAILEKSDTYRDYIIITKVIVREE